MFDIEFAEYFVEELAQLKSFEQDGLISSDNSQIKVSDKGRLLIRNICMVFDFHLKNQTEQKFSKVI